METARMEVCRARTWHVVRTYCVLGEEGRSRLWGQTRAPNLYPQLTSYVIWGQGTHLSESQFLHVH